MILGVGVVGAAGGGDDAAAPTSLPSATVEPFAPLPSTVQQAASTSTVPAVVVPPLTQTLREGVVSDEVTQLQDRLRLLGFDPGPSDGIYGLMTKQSVWAFEKLVLGVPRVDATGEVNDNIWQAVFGEVTITPRRSTNGQANHTEVYLPEQVLVVFQRDVPVIVTHISTGELDANGQPKEYCEEATYDTDNQGRELEEPVTKAVCALAKTPGGVFSYDRQVEGKRVSPLGGMWNPVYFNYGVAVHGALNVPNHPASHGCVRIPMHISEYYQDKISIGDRILVWNGISEPEDVSERDSLPSFDYADPNATTTTTSTTSTVPPTTAAPEPNEPAPAPPSLPPATPAPPAPTPEPDPTPEEPPTDPPVDPTPPDEPGDTPGAETPPSDGDQPSGDPTPPSDSDTGV